jgi:hypothetical protein
MQVRTSDNVTVDDFEQVKAVVRKAQGLEDIKKAESNGKVTYNGHNISVQPNGGYNWNVIRRELEKQIPNVLNDMEVCSYYGGEFYSTDNGVFREKFAKYLNFILLWLGNIQEPNNDTAAQVKVNRLQMKSGIKWVHFVMKEYRSEFSERDFVCVENTINNL